MSDFLKALLIDTANARFNTMAVVLALPKLGKV
jgi:hypothetical protein